MLFIIPDNVPNCPYTCLTKKIFNPVRLPLKTNQTITIQPHPNIIFSIFIHGSDEIIKSNFIDFFIGFPNSKKTEFFGFKINFIDPL